MADPKRFYRLLIKLYPARFREEYEAPLVRQFWDDYCEIEGVWPRMRFWLHALADLGMSIPAEIGRELRQDIAYAARIYRRRRLTTGLAVFALALAIGAATGVFSVVNAVLLRGLPFRDPQRIVELHGVPYRYGDTAAAFSAWRASVPFLEDVAGYSANEMTLGLSREALRVRIAETSHNFFSLLGAEPEIGRAFTADDEIPGRDAVAVISQSLWHQSFGADPRVLGSTIRVNGTPLTVIGVSPAGFDFPNRCAVWTPTAFDLDRLPKTGAWSNQRVGRLKQGVTLAQATAIYLADARRLAPELMREGGLSHPALIPLRDQLAGPVRQASLVLLGVVMFVLLIACANVAHLLLSRVTERRQEIVLRAALGASRSRLVQQLVTESTLLTLAAAAAGLMVAHWTAQLVSLVQPAQLASQNYTVLDRDVLVFAIAIAGLTGLIFGVLPASLIGRMQPAADLVRCQPDMSRGGVTRMRSVLTALQAAFTLMLLAGSFTMTRSFARMLGVDLGYRTDHVVTATASLLGAPLGSEAGEKQYFADVAARLRAVPGVEAAGAVAYLPLVEDMFMGGGFRPKNADRELLSSIVPAGPGYFPAMRTPILAGRDFTDADRENALEVVIVNEAFARNFGGPQAVAGRRVWSSLDKRWRTIVGVARTQAYGGPASGSGAGGPQVFVPIAQWAPGSVTFVARVRGRTEAYLPLIRDTIRGTAPQVPVYNVRTLDERLRDNLARPRLYTIVVLFFGAFALLLAVIGVYGVAAFSIEQRTHEIGVRLAVGASPAGLRAMLLRQSLAPLAAGMAAGLWAALALGRLLEHLMNSADAVRLPACVAAAVILSAAAACAVWKATHRIVQTDPMRVLRSE